MAEHTSWTKPGSVNAADRAPPPRVASASTTSTERCCRAIVMAAANPFGPEPTTTASYERRDGRLSAVGLVDMISFALSVSLR